LSQTKGSLQTDEKNSAAAKSIQGESVTHYYQPVSTKIMGLNKKKG